MNSSRVVSDVLTLGDFRKATAHLPDTTVIRADGCEADADPQELEAHGFPAGRRFTTDGPGA